MDQSTIEVTDKGKRTSGDEPLGTVSEGLSSKESHAKSRVWRKIDVFVMPAITVYYFLAFLVRRGVYLTSLCTNESHRTELIWEMLGWRACKKASVSPTANIALP